MTSLAGAIAQAGGTVAEITEELAVLDVMNAFSIKHYFKPYACNLVKYYMLVNRLETFGSVQEYRTFRRVPLFLYIKRCSIHV